MWLISLLPFRLQLWLGKSVGRLLFALFKKRRHVADRNLQLCFPEMPAQERLKLVKENFENTGMAMFESSMAWWWSNRRIDKIAHVKGSEHIEKARAEGKKILILAPHFLHLEMACRVFGRTHPGVGFYRPHNNPVIEYFQYNGRCRSNNYMIGKRDVKGFLKALSKGELGFYLPDQDYGRNRSEFVPFFAVKETATTTGTLIFAKSKNCVTMGLKMQRLPGTQGYQVEVLPPFEDFPSDNIKADITKVNQWVEYVVDCNKAQYMWLHRRFKTRPNPDDPSLY